MFRQDFSCPALLFVVLDYAMNISSTRLSRSLARLSRLFYYILCTHTTRLLRVRSPLLTESRLISFPLVTKMFQFSRFALITYEFSY
jgi:hypothetical protein